MFFVICQVWWLCLFVWVSHHLVFPWCWAAICRTLDVLMLIERVFQGIHFTFRVCWSCGLPSSKNLLLFRLLRLSTSPWPTLSRRRFGFVLSLCSWNSLFLVLSLSSVIIRWPVPYPTPQWSLLVSNTLISDTISFAISVRKSGSVRFFGPISTDRNRNRLPIMADIR